MNFETKSIYATLPNLKSLNKMMIYETGHKT